MIRALDQGYKLIARALTGILGGFIYWTPFGIIITGIIFWLLVLVAETSSALAVWVLVATSAGAVIGVFFRFGGGLVSGVLTGALFGYSFWYIFEDPSQAASFATPRQATSSFWAFLSPSPSAASTLPLVALWVACSTLSWAKVPCRPLTTSFPEYSGSWQFEVVNTFLADTLSSVPGIGLFVGIAVGKVLEGVTSPQAERSGRSERSKFVTAFALVAAALLATGLQLYILPNR